MPYLLTSPEMLRHDTGDHPEHAGRLRAVTQRLGMGEAGAAVVPARFDPAEPAAITRVHPQGYTARLRGLAEAGGCRIDADTVVSPGSFSAAQLAAGAACEAVRLVIDTPTQTAFAAIRPPGHHASADRAMGFCLLNHAAIAARTATDELSLDRVLVVDWDVHHGNGTQELFYADGRVGYFSAHRSPFYPGTGSADETGAGAGLGATRNLPVSAGVSRDRYLSWFARELGDFADRVRPQLVIVSAGFDSHREDPIGSLGLETEDFADLTRFVLDVAQAHAGGRVVSLLEGGYNPPVLADCVATHVAELSAWETANSNTDQTG